MYDPEEREKEEEDFFDAPAPEEKPRQPRQPALRPDEPGYWEQEESEWEHLQPRRRYWRVYLWLGVAMAVIVLLMVVYIRWFSPVEEEAVAYGYVEKIGYSGVAFRTFEGRLLPYREMMDTTRVYREDFIFSVEDEDVATSLKRLEKKGLPVRVTYDRYNGIVPWRGASKVIVRTAEQADPRAILPPEFRPEYMPPAPQPRNDK